LRTQGIFNKYLFLNNKSNTNNARNSVKYLDIYQNMLEDEHDDF